MGGHGSGTWHRPRRRATVADLPALRLRGVPPAALRTARGLRLDETGQVVAIAWTPCRYGGRRPWLVCPGCGSRRLALYAHEDRIRCRACLGLGYPSQLLDAGARLTAKADRLERRAGWDGDPQADWIDKPRGMHWSTFRRLLAAAEAARAEARRIEDDRLAVSMLFAVRRWGSA